MKRFNNFDFLRLLFSTAVIFSHSFPLTSNPEIIATITNNQLDLGGLSVDIFFVISGYLILNSLKFSETPLNFFWKRCLRIYPGLFVMLLFSLIIIFFVHKGGNIFLQEDFKSYLPNNLKLYKVQFSINNVFKNNAYPNTINGSLWSLCYEFTMYIFVLMLFYFKNTKSINIVLITSYLLCVFANYFYPDALIDFFQYFNLESNRIYKLASLFIAGSLLSLIDLEKYNNFHNKIFLFLIIIISIYLNFYSYIFLFILPILVLLVGISYSKILNYIPHKIGDISYGVYIYGFLIQQTLMSFYKFNPYTLFFLSLIITYIISWFSWNYIELKSLKYKSLFSSKNKYKLFMS
jgi:peptidoglycan/LPS O-acetylase OafA/YrhL